MKKGVLIINLGTPDKPEKKEVRAYLKRFLGDSRVIDTPRWQWLPILHGIILNTRPKKSALLYQSVWREEEGSPLFIYTKAQAELLQEKLPNYTIRFAMSYSKPFISDALQEMNDLGVEDLTIIPLYPQYSTTTTASVADDVARFYLKNTKMPTLHFIHDFSTNEKYIALLAKQIQTAKENTDFEHLILSFHGIPVSYVEKGDVYAEKCQATTEAVMKLVGNDLDYTMTFQSKFGPAEWLTPATDATLKKLPHKEIKKIAVITPGFVADCLETIEEIEEENKEYFMENGGEKFHYIHPFNDDPAFVEVLADIIGKH